MKTEAAITELRDLSKKKPLHGENQVRAKQLMTELRAQGFTNKEICDLTGGGWSEPTVKSYTKGISVEDATAKKEAMSLLREMVSRNLTLDDVSKSLSMDDKLKDEGVTFDELSSLLVQASASGVAPKDLVSMHYDAEESGLSFDELKQTLSCKKELDVVGFTPDSLKKIRDVSVKYGSPEDILEAIQGYGSLQEMRSEYNHQASKKEKLEKVVEKSTQLVSSLEERRASAEETINLFQHINNMGYNEKALQDLENLSQKYGGVKDVIEAVNAYADLRGLKAEVEGIERRRANEESKLKKLNAEHAHLQTLIDMCDFLLNTLKFSIPAIEQIYDIAKIYGKPIEVIKAVGKYGEVKVIEKRVDALSATEIELIARIGELEKEERKYRAILDEMDDTARSLLKPFSEELKCSVNLLKQKFVESIDAISGKYAEYEKRYAKLSTDAGRFEETLKLARVLMAMIKYPSEAKDLPLDYDLMMLSGITQHCMVKGLNIKVEPPGAVKKKNVFAPEIELIDLLQWTMKGLTEGLYSNGRKET